MQLSLASSSSAASSESVDLLNSPTLATADTTASTAGFGDVMAGLLPEPVAPELSESAAADLAGAQATIDFLAWMARTPPAPPPSLEPTLGEDSGNDPTLPAVDDSNGATAFATSNFAGESGSPSMLSSGFMPNQTWVRWTSPMATASLPGSESPAGLLPASADAAAPVDPALAGLAAGAPGSQAEAAQREGGFALDPEGILPVPPPFSGPARGRGEGRGEKIAAGARGRTLSPESMESSTEKNFLNVGKENDGKPSPMVGIGVASGEADMPALTPPLSASSLRPDSGLGVAALESAGTAGDASSKSARAEETPAALAHTAVAAVAKAVERAEAAPRTAVNLQFSIGDSDLVVRIEHRADEVRATFRTDSSELRAALSSEWQSAVSGGSEHALRRVEPVFTSAASSEDPRSSADGNSPGSQQRQAGRESAGEPSTPFAAFLRRSAAPVVNAPSELAPAARAGLVPTALHLQTFA